MGKYKYKVTNLDDSSYFVQPWSSFYLKYRKGCNVKAPKGSLGIMVFNTEEEAERFVTSPGYRRIKRVLPIGKAIIPLEVSRCPSRTTMIRKFNDMTATERAHSLDCTIPPQGTICYPEVFVVD